MSCGEARPVVEPRGPREGCRLDAGIPYAAHEIFLDMPEQADYAVALRILSAAFLIAALTDCFPATASANAWLMSCSAVG